MIIVVGMDNTGKTTICKRLSEEFNMGDVHKSPGPVGLQGQVDWMEKMLKRDQTSPVICERFPLIDETVYGGILRPELPPVYHNPFNTALGKWVKGVSIIIYTRPSNSTILNFGDREQYPGVIEKAEKLLAKYDEVALQLSVLGYMVMPFSHEVNDLADLVYMIREGF